MCSNQEWERFARHPRELIEEDQVRQFVAGAATKLEALAEEFKAWAGPLETDRPGPCGRRARPEWVA